MHLIAVTRAQTSKFHRERSRRRGELRVETGFALLGAIIDQNSVRMHISGVTLANRYYKGD
jgi:hypothetical protein